jgi:DNA-binding HxlR family transcriptional regulator
VLPRDYATQNCSIARVLEIVGDRWTVLVVRSALAGATRFDDFRRRLEIADNVLADRLSRLTEEGILERRQYQDRPVRHEYLVTEKGRELWPILVAMVEWGDRYYAPDGPPRILYHDECGGQVLQHLTCAECDASVRPAEIATRPGPGAGQPPSR